MLVLPTIFVCALALFFKREIKKTLYNPKDMINIKDRIGNLSAQQKAAVQNTYATRNMFENAKIFWEHKDVFSALLKGETVEPMFGFFDCFTNWGKDSVNDWKKVGDGGSAGDVVSNVASATFGTVLGPFGCLLHFLDMFILWCVIWLVDFIFFWVLVGMLVKHWHTLPAWSKWTGLAMIIVTPFVFFPFPFGLIPGFCLPFFGVIGVIVVGVGIHVSKKKKMEAASAAPVTVVAATASPRYSGRSPGRSRLRMR
tara:strand:+ start:423 stop:1187 length:765 start_codon:yes stop_codon:yes gene_type:complete